MTTTPSGTLRASVTADADGAQLGDDVPILVDGADTAVTASGLSDYTPTPGDRLLVQKVGGMVEVMQYLSRGTVPYANSDDFAALSTEVSKKSTTYHQEDDPFTTNPDDVSLGDTWQVPSQGNREFRWDGTTWNAVPVGAGALDSGAIAGQTIPIDTSVGLQWGNPDPTLALTDAPDPVKINWTASQTDGKARDGLCVDATSDPDAPTYLYLRHNTSTKRDLISFDPATGIETVLGGGINLDSSTHETIYGLVSMGNYIYTAHSSHSTFKDPRSGVNITSYDWTVRQFNHTSPTASPSLRNTFDLLNWDTAPAGNGIGLPTSPPGYATKAFGISADPDNDDLILTYLNDSGRLVATIFSDASNEPSEFNTITSTTVIDSDDTRHVADSDSGDADFGAYRYMALVGPNTDGTHIVSMDTSGVIQTDEQITFGELSGGDAFCWSEHEDAFIIQASEAGLDKLASTTDDADRWVAYTWADDNATGGTHETGLSDAVAITIPKRFNVRWSDLHYAAGAASSGSDDANTINLYLADRTDGTPPAPGEFHLAASVTYPTGTIDGTQDLSGAAAPDATNFVAGTSGELSAEFGGFSVKGNSTGAWPFLHPVGVVTMYAGATAPEGHLFCDGSAVSRTTYADLFTAIGTTYGAGDGSTTFNLPDMRNRFPIGAGDTYALGATGGSTTHTLTTAEMPTHTHNFGFTWIASVPHTSTNKAVSDIDGQDGGAGSDATASPANAGSGNAHSILNPYRGMNFIIFTGVSS